MARVKRTVDDKATNAPEASVVEKDNEIVNTPASQENSLVPEIKEETEAVGKQLPSPPTSEPEMTESKRSENVENQGKETELPDHVKNVLRIFSNLPEAYVDSIGGVYSADSKPSSVNKAILYKNPFYHPKK